MRKTVEKNYHLAKNESSIRPLITQRCKDV